MQSIERALWALLLGLLWATYTLAQTIVPGQLSGNECWNAGQGPGGPSTGFVCTFMMNSTQSVTLSTGAAPQTMSNQQSDLILTAQPASAANITLPLNPYNGQIVEVINGTTVAFATNVFSITASGGATIIGGSIPLTTLAAGASKELRYVASTNSWYPVR